MDHFYKFLTLYVYENIMFLIFSLTETVIKQRKVGKDIYIVKIAR